MADVTRKLTLTEEQWDDIVFLTDRTYGGPKIRAAIEASEIIAVSSTHEVRDAFAEDAQALGATPDVPPASSASYGPRLPGLRQQIIEIMKTVETFDPYVGLDTGEEERVADAIIELIDKE